VCRAEDEIIPIVLYSDPDSVNVYPVEISARRAMLNSRHYPDLLTLLTADAYKPIVGELEFPDMQFSDLRQSAKRESQK